MSYRTLSVDRPNGDKLAIGNPSPSHGAPDALLTIGLYNCQNDLGDAIDLSREDVARMHAYLGQVLADAPEVRR